MDRRRTRVSTCRFALSRRRRDDPSWSTWSLVSARARDHERVFGGVDARVDDSPRYARAVDDELSKSRALRFCGDFSCLFSCLFSCGLFCGLLAACQGGVGESESETEGAATTGLTSGQDASDTSAGELTPLCGGIDASLVIDPGADVFDAGSRAALRDYFDALVTETGARVRVHVTPGTETLQLTSCADSPILVWGEGGAVDPAAHEVMECLLDGVAGFVGTDGYNLLGGLMQPVLQLEGWPPADRDDITGLALLLSAADDHPGTTNYYNRPGMAAEAYTRLVGGGARRRVEAFTYGSGADRLPTFTVSLGERGQYFDHGAQPGGLPAALAEWAPRSIAACEAQDELAPVPAAPGCQRLDILFVIDGSGSMLEEQAALKDEQGGNSVFSAFASSLVENLADVEDFHVGVVSEREGMTALHTHGNAPDGDVLEDCQLPPGVRWLEGPSDSLVEDFACLAATSTNTSEEYTAANSALALLDEANAGFVRDDSLVFVVILTDEDTWEQQPTRMQTRANLLEAVGGDLDRLLVLAIVPHPGLYEAPQQTCEGVYGEGASAGRIHSIVRSLGDRGIVEDICDGSIEEAFNSILQTITVVCEGVP